MSNHTPYLQRRGDTFSFRIAVPSELRHIVGKREFIKSLQTTDKRIAVPNALRLAATAKQLFNDLSRNMTDSNNIKLMELLKEKKHKMQLDAREEQHEEELIENRLRHIKELKQVRVEAENEAFKLSLASGAMQKPPLSLFCITGHVQGASPIAATGSGQGYLTHSLLSPLQDRAALLDQLDYGLDFFKPESM